MEDGRFGGGLVDGADAVVAHDERGGHILATGSRPRHPGSRTEGWR